MDKDFETSFIPKKPMTGKRALQESPVSFLTIVSLFVFFTVLLSTGVLYFYKLSIKKNIAVMQDDLQLAKQKFESSQISQLQGVDKRLRASTDIFNNHISVTPIFKALETLTMKSVRYTKFTYTLGTPESPDILVKMSGIATSYRTVALQSDLFAKNKNIIDPVFTRLSLDDTGNVMFDLDFSVEPSFVNYKSATVADVIMVP